MGHRVRPARLTVSFSAISFIQPPNMQVCAHPQQHPRPRLSGTVSCSTGLWAPPEFGMLTRTQHLAAGHFKGSLRLMQINKLMISNLCERTGLLTLRKVSSSVSHTRAGVLQPVI